MGQRKSLHNCVFTIRRDGEPDLKLDYTGLLSWLVEDPQRIFDVAPDFAAQSRGVRNILQSRPPGESREMKPSAKPPVTTPAPSETTQEPVEVTGSDDGLSLSDLITDLINAEFEGTTPAEVAATPKERKPRAPRKRTSTPRTKATTSKKASGRSKSEIDQQLNEARRNAAEAGRALKDLASKLFKAATPDPNTNTMLGAGWDDAVYEEIKQLLGQILDSYAAAIGNLQEAIKLVIGDLRTQYGLTQDQLHQMQPYLVKYFNERRELEKQPKDKPKPKEKKTVVKDGILEADSVEELLAAKVAGYVEIGDLNGEHGIYLVYNDTGKGVRRILLAMAGKDFSAALRQARVTARGIQRGISSPNTRNVINRERLADKTIGVSTKARNVSKFNENATIGDERLGWQDKHADVKLKDLFSVDPEYALWAANHATQGLRAITVREYLRARPEYLEAMAKNASVIQEFQRQVSRVTKERSIIAALKDMGIQVQASIDHVLLQGVSDDQADEIVEYGATWNRELKQFEVSSANIKAFLDALVQRSRGDQATVSDQDVTGGTGIRNPEILAL